MDENRILIFGGADKHKRFNDVWIFDWRTKSWTRPPVLGTPPAPRAHFTATRFFNKVFFFGGYGGYGEVFGDLSVLHILEDGGVQWEDLTETVEGTGPSPRFDHHCYKYPLEANSSTFDKLIIAGGRDLSQMFDDSFVLDLATMRWEDNTQPTCLQGQICMNVADEVESVPYHKVFSFGGKTDMMMDFTNKIEVMDCGELQWREPLIDSLQTPVPR